MTTQNHPYLSSLFQSFHADIENYDDFYQYSISNPSHFWEHLWDFLEIKGDDQAKTNPNEFPKKLLTNKRLNLTENLLHHQNDSIAFSFYQDNEEKTISYHELINHVIQFRAFLLDYEVRDRDHVFAITSNNYETVVAMLATLSIGAIWSYSDVYTDKALIKNRCRLINPKILITANDIYKNKELIYSNEIIKDLSEELGNLKKTVVLDHDNDDTRLDMIDSISFRSITASYPIGEPYFDLFDFYHPACITFASDETPITHSTGHLLLESLKDLIFQKQIRPKESLLIGTNHSNTLWYSFIMALYLEASIHLHDCLDDRTINSALSSQHVTTVGLFARDLNKLMLPLTEDTYPHLEKVVITGNTLIQSDIDLFTTSKPLTLINTLTRPGFLTTFLFENRAENIEAFSNFALGIKFRFTEQLNEQGKLLITNENPSASLAFPITTDTDLSKKYILQDEFDLDLFVQKTEQGIYFKGSKQTALTLDGETTGTQDLYRHLKSIDFICRVVATCKITDAQSDLVVLIESKSPFGEEQQELIKQVLRDRAGLKFVPKHIIAISKIPHMNTETLEKRLQNLIQESSHIHKLPPEQIIKGLLTPKDTSPQK